MGFLYGVAILQIIGGLLLGALFVPTHGLACATRSTLEQMQTCSFLLNSVWVILLLGGIGSVVLLRARRPFSAFLLSLAASIPTLIFFSLDRL